MADAARRRSVVCLAAGAAQRPVIERARALGLAVLAVDRNPAAPGRALADAWVPVGTHEPGPVIRALDALRDRYQIHAVLCRSAGPPVVTAAEVAAHFGLPGVPPAAARVAVDKARLLAFCRGMGLPAPAGRAVSTLAELEADPPALPCVLKPSLSLVGKSGVRRVSGARELPGAFRAARAASLSGRVNVEAFVPGRDVTLLGVVADGRLHPVALLDELNAWDAGGRLRGLGWAVPSLFRGRAEGAAVTDLARRLARELALVRTPLSVSCRLVEGGRPVLTEIHLDLGGESIYDELLPAASGRDLLGDAVARLCGVAEAAAGATPILRAAALLRGPDGARHLRTAPDRHALEAQLPRWGVPLPRPALPSGVGHVAPEPRP